MDDAPTQEATNDGAQFGPGFILHDRYEIEEKLGAGGFAVVYAAFDRTIERKVAIKVLNLHLMMGSEEETSETLQRFLREARVAAKIRHPSSIEVYDFGVLEVGQRPYIIMEFLEGWDVAQELKDSGPMESQRLFPLFCSALDALDEAHEKGIIHKDLKPSNLFLSHAGTKQEILKIVDFGIAHVNTPGKERLTQTGVMSGTPEYLPPEYVEEQSVTEMMDIYQMGLCLVEILCGVPVVQAASPYQAAFKHVNGDLDIPPEFQEGPFGELLDRALAKDPAERFSSAKDFSIALAEIDAASVTPQSLADTQRVEGLPPSMLDDDDVAAAPSFPNPIPVAQNRDPSRRPPPRVIAFGVDAEPIEEDDLDEGQAPDTEESQPFAPLIDSDDAAEPTSTSSDRPSPDEEESEESEDSLASATDPGRRPPSGSGLIPIEIGPSGSGLLPADKLDEAEESDGEVDSEAGPDSSDDDKEDAVAQRKSQRTTSGAGGSPDSDEEQTVELSRPPRHTPAGGRSQMGTSPPVPQPPSPGVPKSKPEAATSPRKPAKEGPSQNLRIAAIISVGVMIVLSLLVAIRMMG